MTDEKKQATTETSDENPQPDRGTWVDRLKETFGIDLRSLGVLRILLGMMILVDLAVRAVTLKAHYTDSGVLTRQVQTAWNIDPYPGRFSFHLMSGEVGPQIVLFSVAALFAVLLIVGYRSKISLLVSLVLLLSVQNRNMEIETGGDLMLRIVCFWALFLPIGARFSLDARAGRGQPAKKERKGEQYFSLATLSLLLQMGMVYFFSALHKDHPIWRGQATAIHYALHIDAYDTWLGSVLREFPTLTGILTRITLGFESIAPFAIFWAGLFGLPNRTAPHYFALQGPLRTITTVCLILFHVGLGSTLALGTFPWFAALMWVGLFPTYAWKLPELGRDWLEKRLSGPGGGEAGEATNRPRSLERRALASLTMVSGWITQLTSNRPRRKKSHFPVGVRKVARRVRDGLAVVTIIYVLLWNFRTLRPKEFDPFLRGDVPPFPDVSPAFNLTRLDQHWGLFAPYPRTSDGYYVVLGRQKNGQEIDYLTPDHRVTWKKPDDVSGSYPTFRFRKFFRNIRYKSRENRRPAYLDYVCRQWNETHAEEEKLTSVTLYFMRRRTRVEGGYEPTEKEQLASRACNARPLRPTDRAQPE